MSDGNNKSYPQILKSSSIIGGSRVLNLLIGMVRTKLVAMLLGPPGIGLVSLYQSATGLTGTLSGLGIGQSAVRQNMLGFAAHQYSFDAFAAVRSHDDEVAPVFLGGVHNRIGY